MSKAMLNSNSLESGGIKTDSRVLVELAPNEPCQQCGAAVRVHYGPDIRFSPPCSKPMMYRAECGGDCLDPSWTAFTKERALELWNNGNRAAASIGKAMPAPGAVEG